MTTYCTISDVNALFGDISDDISTDMFNISITNAGSWIDSSLLKNHIPLPNDDSSIDNILKTASIYFAASDILMSLYHGDEYQSLMDYWFNKAIELLDGYIEAYKAENNVDSTVAHHNALTYKESVQYGHRNRRYY